MNKVIVDEKKEFLRIFHDMCHSRNAWKVWEDLISMIACSVANSTDPNKTGPRYLEREKEYKRCAERLGGVENPARCMAEIVKALERNPEQDFLGTLYMDLGLANHWKGQIFTPYCLSKLIANIASRKIDEEIERNGYISICDPTCGAGSTLIAAVSEMKRLNHNFQSQALFVGQDIDRVAGLMCYIQLSLLGCAGYVYIGDTLSRPMTGQVLFPREMEDFEMWIMPMFRSGVWTWRRLIRSLEYTDREKQRKQTKERFYVFFDFEKENEKWKEA